MKGGVGKTAAAVNLAYITANEPLRTLLIDLDPQGSASFYYRVKPKKKFSSKKLIKDRKAVEKTIRGTDYQLLDALPACMSYRKLDLVLDQVKRSKKRLADLLTRYRKEYDIIYLDCPPNITLVSENVFYASDMLLIPVIPTTLSVITLEKLITFFMDHHLDTQKIVAFFSMVERRKRMHREFLGKGLTRDVKILETMIPYSAVVEKMGLHREPVLCFSPSSQAALAYRQLWDELKRKVLSL